MKNTLGTYNLTFGYQADLPWSVGSLFSSPEATTVAKFVLCVCVLFREDSLHI